MGSSGAFSILVSLCNLPQAASSGLLQVDSAGHDTRLIDIGSGGRCVGCTGLAFGESLLYCAWIGPEKGCFLSILDVSSLAVLECVPLADVSDVHSLGVCDGWLYLVSTGTDEVRRIPANQVASRSELVWRASSSGSDTHHVNSILAIGARLMCSAFGPKRGERWSSATDGYVIDIGSGQLMCQGIEHPHSLAIGPDDIYVVESRRARVRGLRSERCLEVNGYARGLAFRSDWTAVVATSRGRAHSRELKTIENPADPGEAHGTTGLAVFGSLDEAQRQHASVTHIDLADYGPEIYDVAILSRRPTSTSCVF